MATKRKRKKSPGRLKFGKKYYTKSSCHRKKSDATSSAVRLRKRGYKARVVEQAGTGACVYKAGRSHKKK